MFSSVAVARGIISVLLSSSDLLISDVAGGRTLIFVPCMVILNRFGAWLRSECLARLRERGVVIVGILDLSEASQKNSSSSFIGNSGENSSFFIGNSSENSSL